MRYVEKAYCVPDSVVFGKHSATHSSRILNRHLPPPEIGHLGAEGNMNFMEWRME
jgi:hypothetical protein